MYFAVKRTKPYHKTSVHRLCKLYGRHEAARTHFGIRAVFGNKTFVNHTYAIFFNPEAGIVSEHNMHSRLLGVTAAVTVFIQSFCQEADALAGGLSLQGQVVARYMLCSGRVRLPVNTLILKISDELDPVIDFLPPSLCPACSATVQRKPHKEDQAINSILVRSSSADLSNVPMRIALDVAQNVFYGNDHEHMIVDEEMLQLGYGHMALRLTVPSTASVYSALRLGLPGCSIDYLPSTPARLTVTVYPASVHLPHANSPSLNPSEVAQWLSSVGNCHVASYTSGCSAHAVVAELASVGCWHRALALNGELWQRTVMIVSATENFESHACTLSSRPSTRRIMLYWLRALSGLGVVAKRLVLAFLGDPPVMVPSDIGSLEDAMRVSRNVIIVGGHYTLPQGLKSGRQST